MAATLVPPDAGSEPPASLLIGNTGEIQLFYNDVPDGHVFRDNGGDNPEQPGVGGPIVRIYDQNRDGLPSPGTTYGLPRVFNNDANARSLNPVSQTGDGTGEVTTVYNSGADGLFEITQTAAMTFLAVPDAGDVLFVQFTNVIRNTSGSLLNLDHFVAADLTLAGFDVGLSFGERDPAGDSTIATGFASDDGGSYIFAFGDISDPGLPPPRFKAGTFDAIWNAIDIDGNETVTRDPQTQVLTQDGRHFDDQSAFGFVDNALGMEWQGLGIPAGGSETITYNITFTYFPQDPDAVSGASLVSAPNLRDPVPTSQVITVDYFDAAGIDESTLGDANLIVGSPGFNSQEQKTDPREQLPSDIGDPNNPDDDCVNHEYPQRARLRNTERLEVDDDGNATRLRATYEVSGPVVNVNGQGTPTPFPAGLYTMVYGSSVNNLQGNPLPGGDLGTFEVGPPTLDVTPTADAAALGATLFQGTGVTVAGATISAPPGADGAASTGTFTSTGYTYNTRPGSGGVVISTGDARSAESGGNGGPMTSTPFDTDEPATGGEQDLLDELSTDTGDSFRDVTRIDFDIDAPAGLNELFFNFAFATDDERPGVPDVFGLFVNGQNVATAPDGSPARTPTEGLDPHTGTALDKALTDDGLALLTRRAALNPGARNTVTLIVADGADALGDTAAYVTASRERPTPPDEPVDESFGEADVPFVTEAVAFQGDKTIAAGYDVPAGSVAEFVLRRINPDGSNDNSFGGGDGQAEVSIGGLGGHLYDVEIGPDNRIYATGDADGQLAVARFLPDGQVDPSFGDGGTGIKRVSFFNGGADAGYALALDGDKVVVVGTASRRIGGKVVGDFGTVRFLNNGQLDTSFVGDPGAASAAPDGMVVGDSGDGVDAGGAVAVHNGRYYVAGRAGNRVIIAAYGADGRFDTSFGIEGAQIPGRAGSDILQTNDRSVGLAVTPGGQILLAASAFGFAFSFTETDFGIVRLNPDGSMAPDGFGGPLGYAAANFGGTDDADDIDLLADGGFLVSGTYTLGDILYTAAARFRPDGTLDPAFGAGGISFFNPVNVSAASSVPNDGGPLGSGLAAVARRAATALRGDRAAVFGAEDADSSSGRALEVVGGAPADTTPPATSLAPPAPITQVGSTQPLTLQVTFTDATGVDASDITAETLSVVRRGTSEALTVTGVTLDSTADGPTRVATYTVAPPGGSWDAGDDGTYDIAVKGGLISDTAAAPNTIPQRALGEFVLDLDNSGGSETRIELGTIGARRQTFQTADGTPFTVTLKGGAGKAYRVGDAIDVDVTERGPLATLTVKTGRGGGINLRNVTSPGGLRGLSAKTAGLRGTLSSSGIVGKVVLGAVDGGRFEVAGLTSLQVASLTNTQIRATGSLGKIAVTGAVTGSTIFAGVRGDLNDLPDGRDDFANGSSTIASVSVRGAFSNSRIAAPTVGKVAMRSVQTANGGAAFGLAGGFFSSVSAPAPVGRKRLLNTPDESQQAGDFLIRVFGPAAGAATSRPAPLHGGGGGGGAPPARA